MSAKRHNSAWWAAYHAYLQTAEWAALRVKVFERSPICQGCGDGLSTQVHHLTYKNLGREFLFELIGICAECHRRYHTPELLPHALGEAP